MAGVTFRRSASSRMVDAWSERTWSLPSTGDVGSASIRLPYTSAAASATYIDPDGGSWVEIADEGSCGRWIGIIREIQYGATEIELTAFQPAALLGDRVLHWETTFRHTTNAGYIVGRILREVLPGIPYLWSRYTPADGSDPPLRGYSVNGQDAWSAILDLMELSRSELFIDSETGEVTWEGALAGDLRNTTTLIDGGNLRNTTYRMSGEQRAGEVVAKRGSERLILQHGTATIGYPGQVTVTADAGQSLYVIAASEMERRAGAAVTIGGSVPSSLWTIRERDFVRVLMPAARFGGAEHPCRVLSRSCSDESDLMTLTLQVINEAVGVRVAPPMRAASTSKSGAKGRGSFAQRQRASQRAWWKTWLGDH